MHLGVSSSETSNVAPAVLTGLVRCHYCSKHVLAGDLTLNRPGTLQICRDCWDWHNKALAIVSDQPEPTHCPECKLSTEELSANLKPGEALRWSMAVRKDGEYQLLCMPCGRRYFRQRPDIFRPTHFGHREGI